MLRRRRPRRGSLPRAAVRAVGAVALLAVVGCSAQEPALERPAAAPTPSAVASSAPVEPARAAAVELPPGALVDLVPSPAEVPAGLVPLLQASGPRDAPAVAAFSADADAAARDLAQRGFAEAYVAQYAAPADARSLTAVAVRFADDAGAQADLAADLADGVGDVVEAAAVGDQSQVRRVALPGDDGLELVTVRFRVGAVTRLLAWRAGAPADPAVPLGLAQALAARG